MAQDLSQALARGPATGTARVLLFSDSGTTRRAVRAAVGDVVGDGGPAIEWTEVATHTVALAQAVSGQYDLLILDGEAGKLSGIGVARFVGDELGEAEGGPGARGAAPAICLLLARPQDRWLGAWSGAHSTVTWPSDPFEIAKVVAGLLSGDA
jgi:DNA-binding response OmpR family regulator